MKLLFLLTGLATASVHILSPESAAVDLTGVDLTRWLKKQPVAIVMFYAPRSAEYLVVKPLFEAFVVAFKEINGNFAPAKINCTAVASKNPCLPYADSVFPAFTVFRDGQPWSGEESPTAYQIREEDLHIESTYERMAVEQNFSNYEKFAFKSSYMASLRKAMAELTVLMKEKAAESDDSESEDDIFSPSDDVVVYLTGDDFSARVKSQPTAFVMFYTPRSLFYRRLAQFLDTFSLVLDLTFPETIFAKIDCSLAESEKICIEHAGTAIPSFAVFKNGFVYRNSLENIPAERLKETRYVNDLYKEVETELADLKDYDVIGSLKNALASLVSVHIEMSPRKHQMNRGDEL